MINDIEELYRTSKLSNKEFKKEQSRFRRNYMNAPVTFPDTYDCSKAVTASLRPIKIKWKEL